MSKITPVNEIIAEYKEMVRGTCHRPLEDWLTQTLTNRDKEILQDFIDLAEQCERGHETELNEWRAFKGFRNELNDRLTALTDNK